MEAWRSPGSICERRLASCTNNGGGWVIVVVSYSHLQLALMS